MTQTPAITASFRRRAIALAVTAPIVFAMFVFVSFLAFKGELEENRKLAEFPAIPKTLKEIVAFPSALDKAAQDQFPSRALWIGWVNYLRYKLGYAVGPNVMVGKDGWLFYNASSSFRIVRGVMPAPKSQEDAFVNGLQQRVERVHTTGAPLILMVVPDKQTVYPEYFPDYIKTVDHTQTDRYLELARAHDFNSIIDLRPDLRAHDAASNYYTAWDTHWTGNGAYLAYVRLLNTLKIKPLPPEAFDVSLALSSDRPKLGSRNLANMLGIGAYIHPDFPLYKLKSNAGERYTKLRVRSGWDDVTLLETGHSGPTLILVRDSFSDALMPLLKPHFSRIISCHVDAYFPTADQLKKYKPIAVVQQIVEQNLGSLMWPLKD